MEKESNEFYVVLYPKVDDKIEDIYFKTTLYEIAFWDKNCENIILDNIIGIFKSEQMAKVIAEQVMKYKDIQ